VKDALQIPAFFAVFGEHLHHLIVELLLREICAQAPFVADVFVFDGFHCGERSRRGLVWQPVSADPLGDGRGRALGMGGGSGECASVLTNQRRCEGGHRRR